MLSRRIFEIDFKKALHKELKGRRMSIKELAEKSGIPIATLYKISAGEKDPRLSTVKKIVRALEPKERFIAVIAAKFLLNDLEIREFEIGGKEYRIREYPSNSMDECVISSVRAEKEGACGIVCAPILAPFVEKLVDIPVVIIKPSEDVLKNALSILSRKISTTL